jgi:metal-dependent HD superfamily phosphatase/phosphodiesterase
MREDQMNEFSVNFARLILGKFAKGSVHDIVSVVYRSSHALYARNSPSSILGRSMHLVFYLQKMKRAKFRKEQNSCFTSQVSVV